VDITGDGQPHFLKTNVHIIDGKVICDSYIISGGKVLWNEQHINLYLGLGGSSSLFDPDESDVWIRFYIAVKYNAPEILGISEYKIFH